MGFDFGNIEYVDLVGNEVQITGHKWVALAFGRNDPYAVTRLLGVEPNEVTPEKIEALRGASDVYDSQIRQEMGRTLVRVVIHGEVTIDIRCAQVIQEFRYYNAAELREIFAWLPSRSTPEQLATYMTQIQEHGFRISWSEGVVRVVETG